ncbi:Uncharacterised protein [Yersinia thracica]|uniref:Uncharacterized protein n=1 Tax=Yersinia thracica TaxID=2890319 RepID=A0A0T9NFL8_9GAMM|nr:Uncharacterised protein [Yersinia thracica]
MIILSFSLHIPLLYNYSYIPVILQAACALAMFNNPNHLQDSKLIGILSLAAFLQLELFRV